MNMKVVYNGRTLGEEENQGAETLVQRLMVGDDLHEHSVEERVQHGDNGKVIGKVIYDGKKHYAVTETRKIRPLSWRDVCLGTGVMSGGGGLYLIQSSYFVYGGIVLAFTGLLALIGSVSTGD